MHFSTSAPVQATLPPNSTLVILVDPISTTCRIAQEISKRGHHIAALWTSSYAGDTSEQREKRDPRTYGCIGFLYKVEFQEGRDFTWDDDKVDSIEVIMAVVKMAARSHKLHIAGCIPGSGMARACRLADGLSARLGLSTCLAPSTAYPDSPTSSSATLTLGANTKDIQNKNTQQNLLMAAGLRSIRQVCGTSLNHPSIINFLENEKYPIVVKPASKSDVFGGRIKLCHTKSEAVDHFQQLIGRHSGNSDAVEVICQEYLHGTELVVDHVSYQSKHKTCMVWQFDKRPANGEQRVYFGMMPVDSHSHEAALAIPYVRHCLEALGIQNGPTHSEVILTSDGPVLVELNVRAHGGNGGWSRLAKALTGSYSQIEASVDALGLDPDAFDQLPDIPLSPFKAHGLQVHLVSYSEGVVLSMPGFEVMKCLPSFVSLSSSVTVGSHVDYTTDLATSPGVLLLMNKDESKLQFDLAFCRHLEVINGLFTYKTHLESLARPTAMTFGAAVTTGDGGSRHRRIKSHLDHMVKPSLLRIQSNDRPELARQSMMMKRLTTLDASKEVVVVTDPYSTGCLVVNEMISRGYQVIALWTQGFADEMKGHIPMAAGEMKYYAEITECHNLAGTIKAIYKAAGPLRVVACLAGGEAGVDCADIVSERMNLRTNGTQVANRKDKKVQQELIREAGMRSVRQAAGKKWEDVVEFLQKEQYPVVLKPTDSAGSDGVKLCHNLEEAKEHFHHLFEVEAVNGGFNEEVLCQNFLRGKEYVIDQVSRDGVHKTMMVWVYDKRPANNSAFVYFGMIPVDPNSIEAKILVPYARGVLDVLDVQNGPSHAEVILEPTGPCLVEMNVRAHGGDGNWRSLARGLTGGYSQVEVTVDSYLDKKQFSLVPNLPPSPFKASGQEVILVSFSRGKVIATPGYDVISGLSSFVYMETGIKVGSYVERTVDLLTGIGSVILMHSDQRILDADISTIREMEKNNELFEYERASAMFTAVSQRHLSEIIVQEGDEY
ncbi:hypothetical protein ACHAXR_009051 [Thalassiosira sp. AJA248-18]